MVRPNWALVLVKGGISGLLLRIIHGVADVANAKNNRTTWKINENDFKHKVLIKICLRAKYIESKKNKNQAISRNNLNITPKEYNIL